MNLEETFRHINNHRKHVIVNHVAKVCFRGSTGRIFPNETKTPEGSVSNQIKEVLKKIEVGELLEIKDQKKFGEWFEKKLGKVVKKIPKRTSRGIELKDSARKWGYAAKILCLFLREMVLHCRYFEPEQAEKVEQWLYCPIDSKVMNAMKARGVPLNFTRIMDINKKRFDYVQEQLSNAAKNEKVPRIWFDYVWSIPQKQNGLEN